MHFGESKKEQRKNCLAHGRLKAELGNLMLRNFLLLGTLTVAGCVVGPKYHQPSPVKSQPVPETFTINGVVWKTAAPGANRPRGSWWTVFDDPALNRLEEMAAAENQTLAGSVAALA